MYKPEETCVTLVQLLGRCDGVHVHVSMTNDKSHKMIHDVKFRWYSAGIIVFDHERSYREVKDSQHINDRDNSSIRPSDECTQCPQCTGCASR